MKQGRHGLAVAFANDREFYNTLAEFISTQALKLGQAYNDDLSNPTKLRAAVGDAVRDVLIDYEGEAL